MMSNLKFLVVDLFCGAGGTTTGFTQAKYIDSTGKLQNAAKVIACVNHDPVQIQSHWANHPEVRHFEEDIRTLDLTDLKVLVQEQKALHPNSLLILWASLECTNFSNAKGGQSRDADSRTLAEHNIRDIKMRALTVKELLSIQGFPSTYKLKGNQTQQKKGIGNAVVPHVVKAWTESKARVLVNH